MKIAHIVAPDFPYQVELLNDPRLGRRSVIIGGQPDEEGVVYSLSPAARGEGVQVGMSLRQAQQLSASATFLPIDAAEYQAAHRSFTSCLEGFSPLRETVAPGEVCLEVSGLEGLYGKDDQLVQRLGAAVREETRLTAKVGLASNRYAAAVAAELADHGGATIVPQEAEAAFLAPLGILALPASDGAHQLLTRLGMVTLGQVAALPAGALSRTLGREGEGLHRLARGIDDRPIIPEFEAAPLSAHISLDWQLEFLSALVAYAEVLVRQLSAELEEAGLAAGNVIVEVEQQGGQALTAWGYLRPASADGGKLFDRAAGLLEGMKYSTGVTGLTILLTPLQPQYLGVRQIPFGNGNALTPDPLGHTLHTIRDRFGEGSIQGAAAVSGPAPAPVEVRESQDGMPSAVYRDRSWSRIEAVQLHWRLESDWWWEGGPFEEAPLAVAPLAHARDRQGGPLDVAHGKRRDYFRVVTDAGEIMVLVRASPQGRWYLHAAAKPSEWPVR